jgi:hypothetical protein
MLALAAAKLAVTVDADAANGAHAADRPFGGKGDTARASGL